MSSCSDVPCAALGFAHRFTGTLWNNLDPFRERGQADVWAALETVRLSDWVRGEAGGLDMRECPIRMALCEAIIMCLSTDLSRL